MREAFRIVAKKLAKRFKPKLTMKSSNDGVFIRNFQKDKYISRTMLKLSKNYTKKVQNLSKILDRKISKKFKTQIQLI